MGRPDRTEA
uniref:Uncharacterized protein n=1 Tax=Rhizophora mucronata TaxID=61149 RepID=A0A2P2NJG1_RHIMU